MRNIGCVHLHFKEISSTNDYLLELLSKTNPQDGTVISADFQHLGRGQYGRQWLGVKGENIAMSVLLAPSYLDIQDQFYVNKAFTLAIVEWAKAILSHSKIKIKWPNDVYIDNEKVCGILIQNILQGAQFKASIIGIGINVHQKTWPKEIPNPTALGLHVDINETASDLIPNLIDHLNSSNELLKLKNFQKINEDFDSYLWKLNENVNLRYQDEIIKGVIKGVNNYGMLIIKTNKGLESFTHAEAQILLS
jgi:BirA family transcriptional regulator, biotin operon repressor / biotin---[acetyl-CoA-carboxylase] ligase